MIPLLNFSFVIWYANVRKPKSIPKKKVGRVAKHSLREALLKAYNIQGKTTPTIFLLKWFLLNELFVIISNPILHRTKILEWIKSSGLHMR